MKRRELERLLQEHIHLEDIRKPQLELELYPLNQPLVTSTFRRILATSFVFVLLIFSAIYFQIKTEVDSVFTLDYNPSFEIGLNRFGEVVSLKALNTDAEEILNDIPRGIRSIQDTVHILYQESLNKSLIQTNQKQAFLVGLLNEKNRQNEFVMKTLNQPLLPNTFFLFLGNQSSVTSSSSNFIFLPSFSTNPSSESEIINTDSTVIESDLDRHNLLTRSLDELSQNEVRILASSLGITEAKCTLIIQVLRSEGKTQDSVLFLQLVQSDINTLANRLPK